MELETVKPHDLQIKAKIDECIVPYKDYPIKGITYYDLNPIYKSTVIRDLLVEMCYASLLNNCNDPLWYTSYDYIAVVESRGFIIGSILAQKLNKGLILLRSKPGRLPGETSKVKHTLEYGESQMEVQKGSGKVLIFDDVLATGGTAKAAEKVLKKGGYTAVSALFLLELQYCNPDLKLPHESVLTYEE